MKNTTSKTRKTKPLNKHDVSNSKPAVIELKRCVDCPFFERRRMYTADSWEEAYNWFCKKENGKKIAGYVEWHEAHKIGIPEWCPLRK
jgi:hypothetical protein